MDTRKWIGNTSVLLLIIGHSFLFAGGAPAAETKAHGEHLPRQYCSMTQAEKERDPQDVRIKKESRLNSDQERQEQARRQLEQLRQRNDYRLREHNRRALEHQDMIDRSRNPERYPPEQFRPYGPPRPRPHGPAYGPQYAPEYP